MIYLRASELLREGLPPVSAQALGDPEAPAITLGETATPPTANVPSQYVVMIQGKAFVKFAGLLQMAHERGLSRAHRRPGRSTTQDCPWRVRWRSSGWPTV